MIVLSLKLSFCTYIINRKIRRFRPNYEQYHKNGINTYFIYGIVFEMYNQNRIFSVLDNLPVNFRTMLL